MGLFRQSVRRLENITLGVLENMERPTALSRNRLAEFLGIARSTLITYINRGYLSQDSSGNVLLSSVPDLRSLGVAKHVDWDTVLVKLDRGDFTVTKPLENPNVATADRPPKPQKGKTPPTNGVELWDTLPELKREEQKLKNKKLRLELKKREGELIQRDKVQGLLSEHLRDLSGAMEGFVSYVADRPEVSESARRSFHSTIRNELAKVLINHTSRMNEMSEELGLEDDDE